MGGILFAAESLIPVGTLLDLTLYFYPGLSLVGNVGLQGKVVRCFQTSRQDHFRIACSFEPIENYALKKLKSFLEQLMEKFHGS